VTIVPRGKSLGAAWYIPEERHITNFEQMFDEMCALLGGRAAESTVFGKLYTGAQNDLERATKMAFAMITYYGLDPVIGNLSYYDSTGQSDYAFNRPYSEKTAQNIDERVHQLVESALAKAKEILENHRDQLNVLAQILIDREVIFAEDLEMIYGKRPSDNPVEESVTEAPAVVTEQEEKNTPTDTHDKLDQDGKE
jgi:cell division protease FtsH